jgi:hypothetical protein
MEPVGSLEPFLDWIHSETNQPIKIIHSLVPAGLNLSSNISNNFFKALQITKKKKETIAHALQTSWHYIKILIFLAKTLRTDDTSALSRKSNTKLMVSYK